MLRNQREGVVEGSFLDQADRGPCEVITDYERRVLDYPPCFACTLRRAVEEEMAAGGVDDNPNKCRVPAMSTKYLSIVAAGALSASSNGAVIE